MAGYRPHLKSVSWVVLASMIIALGFAAVTESGSAFANGTPSREIGPQPGQPNDPSTQFCLVCWIKRGWACIRCIEGGIVGDSSQGHKDRCNTCAHGSSQTQK